MILNLVIQREASVWSRRLRQIVTEVWFFTSHDNSEAQEKIASLVPTI